MSRSTIPNKPWLPDVAVLACGRSSAFGCALTKLSKVDQSEEGADDLGVGCRVMMGWCLESPPREGMCGC